MAAALTSLVVLAAVVILFLVFKFMLFNGGSTLADGSLEHRVRSGTLLSAVHSGGRAA